jgi:hypothetical protein
MLTDTTAKKAKPADKPYKLADSGGLYLAVMPEGGKLWRWKYRFGDKEKLMAVGKYPHVSLAQAREFHADACGLLAAGVEREDDVSSETPENQARIKCIDPFAETGQLLEQ